MTASDVSANICKNNKFCPYIYIQSDRYVSIFVKVLSMLSCTLTSFTSKKKKGLELN